jgi:hypothetical protein
MAVPGVLRGNVAASLTLLTLVVVSAVVVFVVLLGPARSSAHHAAAKIVFWSSAYFLTIGLAFMFAPLQSKERARYEQATQDNCPNSTRINCYEWSQGLACVPGSRSSLSGDVVGFRTGNSVPAAQSLNLAGGRSQAVIAVSYLRGGRLE